MKRKIWTYKDYNEIEIKKMSEELGVLPFTAQILTNRKVIDTREAKRFIDSSLEQLHDPFLLKDMKKAVDRIQEAIQKNEKIWIYGDYDVDGVSSTSIMLQYFKTIDFSVDYYIPDRVQEGYGINQEAIQLIKSRGGNLIITVDCGITSFEEIALANSLSIDMIITDHHECQGAVPEAYAIINPKQHDCSYPFDSICGCGLALKLIQALTPKEEFKSTIYLYIDIVAIATVADIVPLVDENRIFVKNGLQYMPDTKNLGVQALLEVCKLKDRKLNAGHIGFSLGPRINAAGRIGSADSGVKLLTSSDPAEVQQLAHFLNEENQNRQEIEVKILDEAINMIESSGQFNIDKVLVLAKEGWHHGVIGIVASRIVERYHKPVIILAIEGDKAKGSARSIPKLNLFEAMNQCKDLFLKIGGHEQAAGLTLKSENIEAFRMKINDIVNQTLSPEDFIAQIHCDGLLSLDVVEDSLIDELGNLEPYGMGNPSPKFIGYDFTIVDIRAVGVDGKHLKLKLGSKSKQVDAIGFNFGDYSDHIEQGDKIHLVYTPEFNEFRGQKNIQLQIKDIKTVKPVYSIEDDFIKNYYDSLELKENHEINLPKETYLSRLKIFNSRESFISQELKEQKQPLILVYTINETLKLMNFLDIRNRSEVKKVNFYFYEPESSPKTNEIHVVVNPNIDKIDLKRYNNIILYDMPFNEGDLVNLIEMSELEEIIAFHNKDDELYNEVILKSIIPTKMDLAKIYKLLKNQKTYHDGFSLETIARELQHLFEMSINKVFWENTLRIFQEGSLLEYRSSQGQYQVKLNPTPQKIDIEALDYYQKLLAQYKDFEVLRQVWKNYAQGGN
ncbi:single-stranded-DNA-specific exonuclease RecJ [Alkaliphilus metalliredigens QYMF]|uniref:Single-stranded-DNA-specific exonuclease RecJ n=1 Tax=Alkaliphilus metalliredigens (strain QYMF) TaxID=293826 RepID=A6TQN7_ALKMQ|nr:single-stranded-DNA-specific exonuclease RecJ [Alkaliphilus metalliredigens]ABR48505.1 single-stranded-DNA-specific exonuclease RecJ [Alkaliphilus metalliredigens QYMF]